MPFFKFPCCVVPPFTGVSIIICIIFIGSKCKSEYVITADYLVAKSNYPEMDANCSLLAPGWVGDNYLTESASFLTYEYNLKKVCNMSDPFYLNGGIAIGLSPCRTITICNATYCVHYGEKAAKFTTRMLGDPCSKELFEVNEFVFKPVYDGNRFRRNYSAFHLFDLLINSKNGEKIQRMDEAMKTIAFNKDFADTLDRAQRSNCSREINDDLYFEGIGELASECQQIRICNRFYCQIIPRTATAYSVIFRRMKIPTDNNYVLPGFCTDQKSKRSKRRVIPFTEAEIGSTFPFNKTESTFSIFRIKLPGYRYCGPGTNVEDMDFLGGPLNELDNLCRNHDVAYQLGVPTDEADAKLLEDMWRIRHAFLPLFVAALEAKRYHEKAFGSKYTSRLLYFQDRQKSPSYTMWENSVYRHATMEPEKVKHGVMLEGRWKKLLHNIWSGHCYAKQLPLGGNYDNTESPSGSCSASTDEVRRPSTLPSVIRGSLLAPQDDIDSCHAGITQYPLNPSIYGQCRLLISEIGTAKSTIPTFIELQRRCPSGSRNTRAKTMTGYYILLIRIGDVPRIYLSHSLSEGKLKETTETNPETRRGRYNYYYVIGSNNASPDLSFDRITFMVRDQDGNGAVPEEATETFAIVLLNIPDTVENIDAYSYLGMNQDDNANYLETPVDDIHKNIIKRFIQDILIYGAPCELEICDEFTRLIPTKEQVQPVNRYYIPVPYVTQNDEEPYLSINRCATNHEPMQDNDFAEGEASPGRQNKCPLTTAQEVSLHGVPLQSSAQKLVVNTHNFFEIYYSNPTILTQNPVQQTSTVSGLSTVTVRKILRNWRTGVCVTPGKRRNNPFLKQMQIDSLYVQQIRQIIQGFYADNRAPFFKDIYTAFNQHILDTEAIQQASSGVTSAHFTIGTSTFRKVLHKLGYKFGIINLRDVVLTRPDIVAWRGRYLTELRKNRRSENPLKVIYLDETWIDPHARTGKGWVLAHCSNYRERAKYTFKRNKVSRGPRVIILNAGGENGMLHAAMDVFPVHKKDVSGDYHDNVNAVYYTKWFRNLILELEKTGEKYIIVQDNAPYHGATEIPKQKDRKATMYDWLKDNLSLPAKDALLDIKRYRKFELWDQIKSIKATKSFFTIDKIAEDAGHRVLRHVTTAFIIIKDYTYELREYLWNILFERLPPYNCDLNPIELVWKDVKDSVRKQNQDQNVKTITELAKKVMMEYPVEKWQAHVGHIRHLEDAYWEQDGFLETYMDENFSLIIPVNEEDTDDENEDYDGTPTDPSLVTSIIHDLNDDDDELLDI